MSEHTPGKWEDVSESSFNVEAEDGRVKYTPGPLKVAQAFQNNGPNYWIVHEGKASFGAKEVARFAKEEDAYLFVAAPEMYEQLNQTDMFLQDVIQLLNDIVADGDTWAEPSFDTATHLLEQTQTILAKINKGE